MKIGICGHFTYKNESKAFGGQTIKTRNYYKVLCEKYGSNNIIILDTDEMKKSLIKSIFNFIKIIFTCDTILIMPTASILCKFIPILGFIKKVFNFKLIYIVIGGWLPTLLEEKKYLQGLLLKFDGIYIETHEMVNKIKSYNIDNVYYAPNFSLKKRLNIKELDFEIYSKPYKLCTFSRVVKEKGIEIAIDAINKINSQYNELTCTLYIYGQIDDNYADEFGKLLEANKDIIFYKGIVSGDKSIEILSEYSILLFPTYYDGEGFPGTLIDAFNAGLPIIASDWKYNKEIIKNGKTGLIFDMNNKDGLVNQIKYLINNPNIMIEMKKECINENKLYEPEKILDHLFKIIESK